jgi:purine-nucleoside phosphorylase
MALLDNGGLGIFTGPDVVKDKVIVTGDPRAESSVSDTLLSRQSLNNNGQIAFQVTLADGRMVIVRAEPKKPLLN